MWDREVERRREVVECEVCWWAREGTGHPSMLRVMRSAAALATMRLALLFRWEWKAARRKRNDASEVDCACRPVAESMSLRGEDTLARPPGPKYY